MSRASRLMPDPFVGITEPVPPSPIMIEMAEHLSPDADWSKTVLVRELLSHYIYLMAAADQLDRPIDVVEQEVLNLTEHVRRAIQLAVASEPVVAAAEPAIHKPDVVHANIRGPRRRIPKHVLRLEQIRS